MWEPEEASSHQAGGDASIHVQQVPLFERVQTKTGEDGETTRVIEIATEKNH